MPVSEHRSAATLGRLAFRLMIVLILSVFWFGESPAERRVFSAFICRGSLVDGIRKGGEVKRSCVSVELATVLLG
jgi:hypothetical protein